MIEIKMSAHFPMYNRYFSVKSVLNNLYIIFQLTFWVHLYALPCFQQKASFQLSSSVFSSEKEMHENFVKNQLFVV